MIKKLSYAHIIKNIFVLIFIIFFWFSFIIWQHMTFGFYNVFTLTLLFFIFLIFWYEKILKLKKKLPLKSKKIIVGISFVIFVDIIANIFESSSNDITYIGKNLTLKDITEVETVNGIGYLLKDGDYALDIDVFNQSKLVSEYSALYTIRNNRRIIRDESTKICPDIILLGGSHNFGQALPDNLTLQSMLKKKGLDVVNFSVPGFGLLKSQLYMESNFNNFKTCNPKTIIYRFIADHINRDNGKSFYVPNGSFLSSDKEEVKIIHISKSKFSNLKYYFFLYFPTRVFYYANKPNAELSINLIVKSLSRVWYYVGNDISRSLSLLASTKNLWQGLLDQASLIILIDTDVDFIPEKYLNGLKDFKDIKVIIPPNSKKFKVWAKKNCKKSKYQSKFIKYEGHPTDCLNKFYIEKLNFYQVIK